MTTVALAPLLSAVLGALVGAVSVTLAFSLVILGVARYADSAAWGAWARRGPTARSASRPRSSPSASWRSAWSW